MQLTSSPSRLSSDLLKPLKPVLFCSHPPCFSSLGQFNAHRSATFQEQQENTVSQFAEIQPIVQKATVLVLESIRALP